MQAISARPSLDGLRLESSSRLETEATNGCCTFTRCQMTYDYRLAMTNESADLARLEAKLDTIIRLLAFSVAPDNLPLKERARDCNGLDSSPRRSPRFATRLPIP